MIQKTDLASASVDGIDVEGRLSAATRSRSTTSTSLALLARNLLPVLATIARQRGTSAQANARRVTKTDFAEVTLFDPQADNFRFDCSITSIINF